MNIQWVSATSAQPLQCSSVEIVEQPDQPQRPGIRAVTVGQRQGECGRQTVEIFKNKQYRFKLSLVKNREAVQRRQNRGDVVPFLGASE